MRQIHVVKRNRKDQYSKPFAAFVFEQPYTASHRTVVRFTSTTSLNACAFRVKSLEVRFELSFSLCQPLHKSRSDVRVSSMHHGS